MIYIFDGFTIKMPLFFIRFFVPPFQNIKMFDFIDTYAYKVYNIR